MLEGIDYFGGDILFEQEDSPMHCAIRCRKEHACKRWTFAKVPKTGHCSLLKTNNASTASLIVRKDSAVSVNFCLTSSLDCSSSFLICSAVLGIAPVDLVASKDISLSIGTYIPMRHDFPLFCRPNPLQHGKTTTGPQMNPIFSVKPLKTRPNKKQKGDKWSGPGH